MGSNASSTAPLVPPPAAQNQPKANATPKNNAASKANATPKNNATPKANVAVANAAPNAAPTSQLATSATNSEKPAMNTKGGWAAKAGIPTRNRRHRGDKATRRHRRSVHKRRI